MYRTELRDKLDEILEKYHSNKKKPNEPTFKPEAKAALLALANETFDEHELYEILFTFAWPDDTTGMRVTDWMREIVDFRRKGKP